MLWRNNNFIACRQLCFVMYIKVCPKTNSPGCILLLCHFSQVSLLWWEHLQLPAQPPEINSQLTPGRWPPDLGSARVARLPREPVAPGGPQLEGHGEGSLLYLQSSTCSDLMHKGTFCVLLLCRWLDFLSPKLWMTWRCSIWPPYRLWLWVLCFWPNPALSRTPLYSLVRRVTTVYSHLFFFFFFRSLARSTSSKPLRKLGTTSKRSLCAAVWAKIPSLCRFTQTRQVQRAVGLDNLSADDGSCCV